ncbi:unnamed protein product [Rotaria sp. Silwood2]|nr:unnamed protein product [Rotaria sp. Silwood2]
MDLFYAKIVQEIESYITDANLNNDYIIANCVRENDGWIRLELLSRCNKLSSYNYDTILQALHSKYSNIIELSSFTPRCIRHRCQPLTGDSIQDNRTVIVTGLPYDARHEELIEFFNHFYPVKEIKMFSLSNRFNGIIHLIFKQSQDALEFVQRSKLTRILYVRDNSQQLSNGYDIACKMLTDNVNKDFIEQNNQQNFIKGRPFSTRLANLSSRVSFNTNISLTNDNPGVSLLISVGKQKSSYANKPCIWQLTHSSHTKECLLNKSRNISNLYSVPYDFVRESINQLFISVDKYVLQLHRLIQSTSCESVDLNVLFQKIRKSNNQWRSLQLERAKQILQNINNEEFTEDELLQKYYTHIIETLTPKPDTASSNCIAQLREQPFDLNHAYEQAENKGKECLAQMLEKYRARLKLDLELI